LSLKHENPFFLAAGTWKPHDPWEVPQKYFDMYPLDAIVLPEVKEDDLEDAFDHGRRWIQKWVNDNHQWEKVVQSYAASITFADAMIGRLFDALEASEYANNTIVVLWSDHGMHMGEKENIEKFTLWEKSTRVPLIINVTRTTRGGSTCNQPVSLMDLYPTLVELTGFETPVHLDGRSLVPQINDPELETDPVVSSYMFSWTKKPVTGHAVRSLNYRYIYYPDINLEELYDHQSDPEEWDNIAYRPENRQIIQNHRNLLLEMLPELTWSEITPSGYEIDETGHIRNLKFVPLEKVVR
jgi:arylsulfatase A-like enzyme